MSTDEFAREEPFASEESLRRCASTASRSAPA